MCNISSLIKKLGLAQFIFTFLWICSIEILSFKELSPSLGRPWVYKLICLSLGLALDSTSSGQWKTSPHPKCKVEACCWVRRVWPPHRTSFWHSPLFQNQVQAVAVLLPLFSLTRCKSFLKATEPGLGICWADVSAFESSLGSFLSDICNPRLFFLSLDPFRNWKLVCIKETVQK